MVDTCARLLLEGTEKAEVLFSLREAVVHINKSYLQVKLTSHTGQ